jgi:putative SOS response-associated peptidase YedK
MCGRYASWGVDLLGRRFLIVDPTLGFCSHFNIAPQSENPIVVTANDGNHIRMMQWELVPHWAKDISATPRFAPTLRVRFAQLRSARTYTATRLGNSNFLCTLF